jgi:hypothetical protein
MRSASNALKQHQHQVRQHRLLHQLLRLPQRLWLRQQWHLRLWLRLWQHANLRLWPHVRLRLWLHLHRHRQLRHLLRLQRSQSLWAFSRAWWSLSLAALGQRLRHSACLSGRRCQNSTK